jgi:hypothetical protein
VVSSLPRTTRLLSLVLSPSLSPSPVGATYITQAGPRRILTSVSYSDPKGTVVRIGPA